MTDESEQSGIRFRHESGIPDPPTPKIRRTPTACLSCRKIKGRCEVPPFSTTCRRCKNLGIHCILPRTASPDPPAPNILAAFEERLQQLEAEVRELKSASQSQAKSKEPATSGTPPPSHGGHGAESPDDHSPSPEGPLRPVKLIRSLQTQYFGAKADFSFEAFSLGSVVTAGKVDPRAAGHLLRLYALLDIPGPSSGQGANNGRFLKHFGFWLSLTTEPPAPETLYAADPLLFSTACLLATRFVPELDRATIYDMYDHVRRLASSALLNTGTVFDDVIRSYVLLCFWSPTIQSKVPLDSWLLSSMASNQILLALDLSDSNPKTNNNSPALVRLWACLCITQLQYSIGNGRPLSIPQLLLRQCADHLSDLSSSPLDQHLLAELTLYQSLHNMINDRARLPHLTQQDLEMTEWAAKWQHLLVVTDTTVPRPSSLAMGVWYCRLLLRSTRLRFQGDADQVRDQCKECATRILSDLNQTESTVVAKYSDYSFFVAAYAALFLCDWDVDDALIESTIEQLMAVAANDEHIAYRHACVIQKKHRQAKQRSQPVTATMSSEVEAQWLNFMPPFSQQAGFENLGLLGFNSSMMDYQI